MQKYFKFSSNKSPLSYKCGEKMIFSIFAKEDGRNIACEHINWEIRGDDGKTAKGSGSCTPEQSLVLETTLERAGFVHIICTAVNENGEKLEDFDMLESGAGAEVKSIEYHDTIPEDFDIYWGDIEKLVAEFPIEVLYKEQVTQGVKEGFVAYDIRIKTPCGRPASGYITMPVSDGKYKLNVLFNGYSISGSNLYFSDDTVFANFNAHGIENHIPQEKLINKYKSELEGYGFSDEENASNMTTYFRNMMIRNLIAVKFLKTLPQWDGKNLCSSGGSQGAFQATTLSAHDKDVTMLDIGIPWFCDLNAINSGYLRGWRPNFAEGLRYFDTVAQATRVKCPVKINARLGDYVCPPSTVMALYNSFKTEKHIIFTQSGTHGYLPPEIEQFLLD